MALDLNDLTARAMRVLGLHGSPRKKTTALTSGPVSRKYAVDGITASVVALPQDPSKSRPTHMLLTIGSGITGLYLNWDDKTPATVPTTGANGVGEQLVTGQVIALWYGKDAEYAAFTLMSEGAGTIVITYYWT